jgi:arylsulfatase A-like enzyme
MKSFLPVLGVALGFALSSGAAPRPNVVIVMTDDQGYGELSVHGNPVLKTPHLDRLHAQSVRFTDFHVAPMCTPTRGQLLTGVDAIRNGAMNVSSGRTLLRREFPTMADMFQSAGYRTGLFGKWHLGDNFPYRPQDRGFTESLWFPSSHINSVPDHWDNDYFDDVYTRNGTRQAHEGYTTDVFFREAIDWMRATAQDGRPFLCYIPTAAPHWPFFVPDQYRGPVAAALAKAALDLPQLNDAQQRDLVSYLAMIANIDDNMGRLETFLKESGLRDNTIVLFLTDNGSTFGPRYYNAGMKGGKVTLWEGGHRVPCFVRWPGGSLRAPGDVGGLTQVQDLLPTLLDLCGVKKPARARFDGISLAPVLRGEATPPEDRMLVIHYSRMPFGNKRPVAESNATVKREGAGVLWRRWRLLEGKELYNLEADPLQEKNVLADHPEVVAKMRAHLNAWWDGVKDVANRHERVVIGADAENPSMLTACEWVDVFVAADPYGGPEERLLAARGGQGRRV